MKSQNFKDSVQYNPVLFTSQGVTASAFIQKMQELQLSQSDAIKAPTAKNHRKKDLLLNPITYPVILDHPKTTKIVKMTQFASTFLPRSNNQHQNPVWESSISKEVKIKKMETEQQERIPNMPKRAAPLEFRVDSLKHKENTPIPASKQLDRLPASPRQNPNSPRTILYEHILPP